MRGEYSGYTSDTSGGAGSFLLGMACGAAVGAAVALLMAPKSGAELRSDLAEQADGLKRAASDTYDQAVGQVGRIVEKGRRAARDMGDTARQAGNEFSDAAKSSGYNS